MTMPVDLPAPCRAVAGDLAELALGVLPGRERAAALAHLDTCDRCRAEVEQLSLVADGVLRATPQMEPPAGFEERVLAKMGRRGDPPGAMPRSEVAQRRHAAQRRQRRLVLSLAAAVVALSVPLGVILSEGGSPPAATPPGAVLAGASLVYDGHAVGHVSTRSGGDSQPAWLSMTIHGAGGTGWIRCQVTIRGGAPVTVGTFWIDGGSGHWDAALPVPAHEVTGARLLSPNSSVLATARFT